MSGIQREEWDQIETTIDTCAHCKSEPLFDTKTIIPARPWKPLHCGRLLFISENPPITGGFWNKTSDDGLRKNILQLLKIPHAGNDHLAALGSFFFSPNFKRFSSFPYTNIKVALRRKLKTTEKGIQPVPAFS